MDTIKNLGIWMDHSSANFMEYSDYIKWNTIESAFTHKKKVDALHRSESLLHNKGQQLHEEYYK